MQEVLRSDAFFLFNSTSTTNDVSTTYCWKGIWNERQAKFTTCFVPIIAFTPTAVAILALLWQALGLLIPWRPKWMKPFVQEVYETPYNDDYLPKRRWSPFVPILVILSIAGWLLQLLVAWPVVERSAPAASWFAIAGLLLVHRPTTAPFSILTIFVLQAISQMVMIAQEHHADRQERDYGIAALIISLIGILLILCMPLRDPNLPAKEISHPMTEPTSTLRSPEDNLTLWHFMTVSWISPLISIGYKRQLQDEDVWKLAYEFDHTRLHHSFRVLKGTVIRRLVKANAIDLCILTFLGIFELVMRYSTPVLLQLLLSSMEDPTAPKRAAITYAAISMVVRLVAAQSGVFTLWYGRRCYERSRGEMITMLYEKTLGRKMDFTPAQKTEKNEANGHANSHAAEDNLAKEDQEPWWRRAWSRTIALFKRKKPEPTVKTNASMGKILNLMRNDVYEVAQRFWEVSELVQKPLSVVFSIALVVRLLGWSSLIAVAAMVVSQIISFGLARVMVLYEKRRRKATDNRLQMVSQFVEAIRHLRWYGWQGQWLTKIMGARDKELRLRIITSAWNLAIGFVNTLALDLTPTIAFFAYTVLAGKPLRVDIAFPAMQLFQMMTLALRDLPDLIITLINAYVAVGRIEDFMAEPDKQELNNEALIGESLALEDASFAWPGSETPVLKNINLSFPRGLTVIVGEVGSGKTALLQGLLGELDQLEGNLFRPHEPIGYCAQTPWLQSMSIRENILFSAPYEEKRYKAILDACALTQDLAEFKAGDLSLIGENGIGLSGGQRARIALARAVYSSSTILLLDDPLSALDQQTAEAIVGKLFTNTMLRECTIVLVTHRTDLVLHLAKQVIEIEGGTASVHGQDSFSSKALHRIASSKAGAQIDNTEPEEHPAATAPDKFIEDEHRAHGGVKASVYWEFVKAAKLRWWGVLIFIIVVYRLAAIAEAWFLKTWGEAYDQKPRYNVLYETSGFIKAQSGLFGDLPPPEENIKPWLLGFFILGIFQSIWFIFFRAVMVVLAYTSGRNMFAGIMERIAGATFRFYDVTPVGRLMNRMTSDIGVIDGNISRQLQYVVWMLISWIASLLVIASVTPTFLVFAILLTIVFVLIFTRFIPASQSLRRLEMVSLTPLMSNFGTLLQGITTVRAFRAQRQFQDRVIQVVDTFQKMDHFYWSLQAWLMYRYDSLSAIAMFLITILALATNVSAGLTAFVLLSASRLVWNTHYLCKQYGQLQMEFVSVERVVELLHLEQEPKGDVSPPAWWPSFSGDIVFKDVMIKYAPHLDPALSGVSFTVKGGSKTAILGRTGSGKSTLALALLATVVPEVGKIMVDNIDLAEVDKQLLRTRVTFLAQDPVLFPGTMRQNLDPVEEHTDEACSLVLQRVCDRQGWSLDTNIETGGRNLSQGQRQLVGLAGAVLRRSAIIILDEATASIDRETAMQIQQAMHEEMKDSTVITIAHRLEAVKNADYCIILGSGHIVQQGPASEMLAKQREHLVEHVTDED